MKLPELFESVSRKNKQKNIIYNTTNTINPQGCDNWKRIRCTVKVGAAAAACTQGPTPWCLAAITAAGDCCDCLPPALRQLC